MPAFHIDVRFEGGLTAAQRAAFETAAARWGRIISADVPDRRHRRRDDRRRADRRRRDRHRRAGSDSRPGRAPTPYRLPSVQELQARQTARELHGHDCVILVPEQTVLPESALVT